MTVIAGIPIPSTSPLFLAVVAIHVLLGISCAITGFVAMLSLKGRGRHSNFGTIYYWCLSAVFVTALGLSVVRWTDDYHLAALGTLSFGAAYFGRQAIRNRWRNWPSLHLSGMGASYILLLTAFYVDNGKNLPLWRELPQIATTPADSEHFYAVWVWTGISVSGVGAHTFYDSFGQARVQIGVPSISVYYYS